MLESRDKVIWNINGSNQNVHCQMNEQRCCICICDMCGVILSHENNEIMPFSAKWMDLKIIMLNEANQRQYHIVSHISEI